MSRRSARICSMTSLVQTVSSSSTSVTVSSSSTIVSKKQSKKRLASEVVVTEEALEVQLSRATTLNADWRGASTKITKSETVESICERVGYVGNVSEQWLTGAHVSSSGGAQFAVENAAKSGCRSFAMFLRQKMSWSSKPLSEDDIEGFKSACHRHGYDASRQVLPHGIYIVNLASPNVETAKKSIEAFTDEMTRCQRLGISRLNIHPGSTCGEDKAGGIATIASVINDVHVQTQGVTVVLENMAGQGSCIGGTFQDLRDIIDLVKDQSRVGVCLDTCHLFAAGYDIRTAKSWEKVLQEFDSTIGMKYLCGMHLNDSKGDLGCHLDRHENIGKGKIGKECFQFVMNDVRFRGVPLILETPPCNTDEVALLNSFRNSSNVDA